MKAYWLVALVPLFGGACQTATPGAFPAGRAIDLTHDFDERTLYWPTEEGFVLERGFEGETDKGYFYSAHRFRGAEHGGTHIDAPIHFHAERHHVNEIPLEQLMGQGVVVDVSSVCTADRDHRVNVEDLRRWEAQNGEIPKESIVLLRTGFGRYWPEPEAYLGTAERGSEAVAKLHFPGLDVQAASWLVRERRIKAVGIDTASIDAGQSRYFRAHQILAAHGVPIFENVANLDLLPGRGLQVIALPMKIRGGSGAPLRIVAIVPGESARVRREAPYFMALPRWPSRVLARRAPVEEKMGSLPAPAHPPTRRSRASVEE